MKEKIKQNCSEIVEAVDKNCHFNFVFDNKIITGSVVNIDDYELSQGVNNNLIGEPSRCADLFYSQILLYAVQIREVLGYNSAEIVFELMRRLSNEVDELDKVSAAMGFKIKTVSMPGKA